MKKLLFVSFCFLLPLIFLESFCDHCGNLCEYCEEDKNFCFLKTIEHIELYKEEMKIENMELLNMSEVDYFNKQIFLSGCVHALECIRTENTLRESRK